MDSNHEQKRPVALKSWSWLLFIKRDFIVKLKFLYNRLTKENWLLQSSWFSSQCKTVSEAWVAFTFFACQEGRSSLIDEENKRGWDKSERNELKQSNIHKEIFNVFEISVCQRQKTFKTINNVKRLIRETFSQISTYRKPPDWKNKERKTVWPRSRLHWKIRKFESYFSFDFPLLLTNTSLIQLILVTSWKSLPPKEDNPIHDKCWFRASRHISVYLFLHCLDFL